MAACFKLERRDYPCSIKLENGEIAVFRRMENENREGLLRVGSGLSRPLLHLQRGNLLCRLERPDSAKSSPSPAALIPNQNTSAIPVKAMEHLYQLLVSAFAKFLAADLSTNQARFGLYGRWVIDGSDPPVPESELQLDQARASQGAWAWRFVSLPNPYSDLVAFYETGASLGRWENHILDVYGPNGEKLWGVPLKSLIDSANTTRII